MKTIECPFCEAEIEIDVEWLKKNGRAFCPNCCKAFDAKVKEEPNFGYKNLYEDWDGDI
jgi:transcription elongation factor Elf1